MSRTGLRFVVLALCSTLAGTVHAREEGEADPAPPRPEKIRVLLVTGGHDFAEKEFLGVFRQPDLEVRHVTQPDAQKWFAADKAGEYDVMVWYDLWANIDEEGKRNLVALLNKGKPLVVLHHAIANYSEWPEAQKIMGGVYRLKPTGDHPGSRFKHDLELAVRIADPEHPVTRGMRDFKIIDEGYAQMDVLASVKPLLTVDHPDSDKLVAWAHTYAKSPVVYIQLGHDPKSFSNPAYPRLVGQAIRHVAGKLPNREQSGFTPLFNGKDLTGWKIIGKPEGFRVIDGVIRSESGRGGDWMRTEKEYGDFILRVEWRVAKDGNSGVFLRCLDADKGAPWDTGSEVQISNEPRNLSHCTGSLYGSVSVDPRPDETAEVWHEFWIECRGPRIKVFADNVPIVDVDGRTVPALAKRPLRGYIGLQDSHNPGGWIEYRKVLIKELKKAG